MPGSWGRYCAPQLNSLNSVRRLAFASSLPSFMMSWSGPKPRTSKRDAGKAMPSVDLRWVTMAWARSSLSLTLPARVPSELVWPYTRTHRAGKDLSLSAMPSMTLWALGSSLELPEAK